MGSALPRCSPKADVPLSARSGDAVSGARPRLQLSLLAPPALRRLTARRGHGLPTSSRKCKRASVARSTETISRPGRWRTPRFIDVSPRCLRCPGSSGSGNSKNHIQPIDGLLLRAGSPTLSKVRTMSNMRIAVLAAGLMVSFTAARGYAMEKLNVMISGGFSQAYHDVLPDFERSTGISVTTLSGASQGTGPRTIKSQLENGADVDVVILSKEGLSELIAAKRIVGGSERELASVPLAAAVRQGNPKPDIGNVEGFKTALLNARLVVMPGSTSGLFVKDEVFPKLGTANKVSFKVVARGLDSTGLLAAGEADLAIGPVSELINQPGIELVGPLPEQAQLVQVFTAAIVPASDRTVQAKKLINFLGSDHTTAAIKKFGMDPVGDHRTR